MSECKLYLVATPIGNLSDMSKRALDVLNSVDFVAAEDTRNTLKLFNKFDIKKPDEVNFYKENYRVLLAGSTHQGEDEVVLDIFKKLKEKHSD